MLQEKNKQTRKKTKKKKQTKQSTTKKGKVWIDAYMVEELSS
jgi:hypothetical protein